MKMTSLWRHNNVKMRWKRRKNDVVLVNGAGYSGNFPVHGFALNKNNTILGRVIFRDFKS